MRERVFSLETEYAVSFAPDKGSRAPDPGTVIEELQTVVRRGLGLTHMPFLVNGSKFHQDCGHAEWSLPECRSAREAAVYDKAADHTIVEAAAAAQENLAKSSVRGRVLVIKNNTDGRGNTYGCHENYMAATATDWLDVEEHWYLTVRYLVPFLVTRQIICGSGRFGLGQKGEGGCAFQMMQRADFISKVVSADTRSERAIVNTGREKEPFAKGRVRRLHLILGDANVAGWSTWLKLGTTGLVLRMAEELGVTEAPQLLDPVGALVAISRDPSCTVAVPLRGEKMCTALAIQNLYYDQVRHHHATYGGSQEESAVLEAWKTTLDLLEGDRTLLIGKIDWVTKKAMMDGYLRAQGLSWAGLTPEHAATQDLKAMDIRYHDLSPQGLYRRLSDARLDSFLPDDEIRRAQLDPPAFTRARVRGAAVALARQGKAGAAVDNWDKFRVTPESLPADDPLEFFDPHMFEESRPVKNA